MRLSTFYRRSFWGWVTGLTMLLPTIAFGGTAFPPAGADARPDPALLASRAILMDTEPSSRATPPEPGLPPEWRYKTSFFTILLGGVYWEDLGEVEPTLGVAQPGDYGNFDAWGYNLEFGYHRRLRLRPNDELRAGLDLGVFFNENSESFDAVILPSGRTIEGRLNSRGLYLTPSVRWLFGSRPFYRWYLGAGAGYYELDFVEQVGGWETEEYFSSSTFGGYLSVGVVFRYFCLESKVHFVDFGDVGRLAPEAGDLTGPIYLFQFGWTF